MAVYNAADYLDETLESILRQTIGFEKNCELIFVNDGSEDDSESICLKYQQKYPSNITYIKQPNLGVSAARNKGIDAARGKYVSFLDSDDLLSPDTLEKVYAYFQKHVDEIDFVSIKIEMFEGAQGDHVLSGKFSRTRIIDIRNEPSALQFSAASSFFKRDILVKFRFDERVRRFGEDLKLMTQLILERGRYGVLNGPVYYYRRREDGQSSTGMEKMSKEWYLPTLNLIHRELIDQAVDRLGHVPAYLQYVLINDLQRRFRRTTEGVLTPSQQQVYKKYLGDILSYVDDAIILGQKELYIGLRLYMLGKKYGEYIFKNTSHQQAHVLYKDRLVYNYSSSKRETIFIDSISSKADTITLKGRMSGFVFQGYRLVFRVDGTDYSPTHQRAPEREVVSLGEVINTGNAFTVKLPVADKQEISYHLVSDDYRKRLPHFVHENTGLRPEVEGSYILRDKYIIIYADRALKVQSNTMYHRIVRWYKQQKILKRR